MSDAFVPLVGKETRRDSAEPFRVKVVAAAGAEVAAFRPAVSPVPMTPPAPALSPEPGPTHQNHAPGEAEVSLTRDGDRITRIQVKCACGEIIDLQCVY